LLRRRHGPGIARTPPAVDFQCVLAGKPRRNPSHHGEIPSLSLVRLILIRRIIIVHLTKGYQLIRGVHIPLDLTAKNRDPPEGVRTNQNRARVGSGSNSNQFRISKSDLIQILQKSYLKFCRSKNNKWDIVGILRTSRIHQYHKILYFMGSIWNHFQIGIKPSVSLLNSYL
jgi:hypothetical protein